MGVSGRVMLAFLAGYQRSLEQDVLAQQKQMQTLVGGGERRGCTVSSCVKTGLNQ